MGRDPGRTEVPRCSLCQAPAVMLDRAGGRHLCGPHAAADVARRVEETVREEGLIVPGDTVAVALSGGKDSTALLLLLSRIVPAIPARLVAITIDEGIAGYRDETIRSAERLVRTLGVEHSTIAFSDLFGDTLDVYLRGRKKEACTICGILRKKALVVGAERAGATKLATGHNLDDEAQSVLMNVLRGDLPRLVRDTSRSPSGHFIPRIKPLSRIAEKEIAVYLLVSNAWSDLPECPYARYALRGDVRSLLAGFEYRNPGTMHRLMESRKKIGQSCSEAAMKEPIRRCRSCGDPCSGELCQFCRLTSRLGL